MINCIADPYTLCLGITPVYLASVYGNNEAVRFLLDKGANINALVDGGIFSS